MLNYICFYQFSIHHLWIVTFILPCCEFNKKCESKKCGNVVVENWWQRGIVYNIWKLIWLFERRNTQIRLSHAAVVILTTNLHTYTLKLPTFPKHRLKIDQPTISNLGCSNDKLDSVRYIVRCLVLFVCTSCDSYNDYATLTNTKLWWHPTMCTFIMLQMICWPARVFCGGIV